MKMHSRKLLALLMSVLMLFTLVTASLTVTAAQDETVIITLSDYQPKDTLGPQRVNSLVSALKDNGVVSADRLFMVGDYNATGDYSQPSSIPLSENGMATIKQAFRSVVDDNNMLFVQGNHDLAAVPGLAKEGSHDPAYGDYGVYVIEEDNYAEWGSYSQASVDALKQYLDEKLEMGWNKPIFILNHIPLHWSNRTIKDGSGTNGYKFFDVINEAGGKGLNIFYLFGHNHSSGYDDFLGGSCIFLKKGDPIEVCQGNKYAGKTETLNFTYMNAGYVGYYSTNAANAENTLTVCVLRIRNNEVTVSRYSADGQYNLKSAGIVNADYANNNGPAVNPTVYGGSYKIAADGTAVAVDSIHDMRDVNDTISTAQISTSEDVRGLAFKFDVQAFGVATDAQRQFIGDDAVVNAYNDGVPYRLLRMGAVVSNSPVVGTDGGVFRLDAVDDKNTVDIPANYVYGVTDSSVSFAVRIIYIPWAMHDAPIYARPYYVFENNGTEITVYGDVAAATYNGQLDQNDGVLEW